MLKHVNHVAKRFIIYVFICLLAGFGIAGVTAFFSYQFQHYLINIISSTDQLSDGLSYYYCLFYGHEILEQQAPPVPYTCCFRLCLFSAADAGHPQQLSGLAYLQHDPGH